MSRQVIVALGLLALVGLGVVAWRILLPGLERQDHLAASDASRALQATREAEDGYGGYGFFRMPLFQDLYSRAGFGLEPVEVVDFKERVRGLAEGRYPLMFMPVSSYLEHGYEFGWPGVIVMVISESTGSDGVLAFGITAVEQLNTPALRIVYVKDSPSEFLIDLMIDRFDLDQLNSTDAWRVEVGSEAEVYAKAKRRDGDVFVTWETTLSKLQREMPDLNYVTGSDELGGFIVDVMVAERGYVRSKRAELKALLESYFLALAQYGSDEQLLARDFKEVLDWDAQTVAAMKAGIDWFDLQENCSYQFGIQTTLDPNPREGLRSTVIRCANVLKRAGKLPSTPIDPFELMSSSILEELSESLGDLGAASDRRQERTFEELAPAGWGRLKRFGTLNADPIAFRLQSAELTEVGEDNGEAAVDGIAGMLNDEVDRFRCVIKGHTGPGDDRANQVLSQQRAEVVMKRLVVVGGVDPSRLRAVGVGSTEPPALEAGENPRALRYRMARVEFILYYDNSL